MVGGQGAIPSIMVMMAQEPYGIIQTVTKSMKSHRALLWHLALFLSAKEADCTVLYGWS